MDRSDDLEDMLRKLQTTASRALHVSQAIAETLQDLKESSACIKEALSTLNNMRRVARQHPSFAVSFAKIVLGGRWRSSEEVIMSEPNQAVRYAKEVLKKRWRKAEPVIAKDPRAATSYAVNVLKERWKEAEAVIATNDEAAFMYAEHVIHRWEKDFVKMSPVWLYMYADRVSCGRLPAELECRMNMFSFDHEMRDNEYVLKYRRGKRFRKR